MKPVKVTPKTYHIGNKFKPVCVYYPQSNKREAALLDHDSKIVGFTQNHVYLPQGGALATQQIENEAKALVEGSIYYQFECRHTHGHQYILGSIN